VKSHFFWVDFTISAGERLTYPKLLTANKTGYIMFAPVTKLQSLKWYHLQYRMKKDFRNSVSADEVKITVIWYCEEVIIVNWVSGWEKVISAAWTGVWKKVKKLFKWLQPYKNLIELLLQYDNARQHTCLRNRKVTRKFDWTVIHQFPYNLHPVHAIIFIICNCFNFG